MAVTLPDPPADVRVKPTRPFRLVVKLLKRVIPLAVAITLGVYFPIVGWVLLAYLACGLIDVLRNRPWRWSTILRYFSGNGVFTWVLSPFNLLLDLLCLPYFNRGVYRLEDLPPGHQDEIRTLIEAARRRNLIALLEEKLGEKRRGMIFFKWYGKNLPTSVEMPEYHAPYRHLRTIGVSIFNKKQSTNRHFGPLRITLRVLYNLNPVNDPNVYIDVGGHTHRWKDDPLFVFDDTLEHRSCNECDAVRYCLFVDILRPSPLRPLLSGILTGVRLFVAPIRAIFYGHWTILR